MSFTTITTYVRSDTSTDWWWDAADSDELATWNTYWESKCGSMDWTKSLSADETTMTSTIVYTNKAAHDALFDADGDGDSTLAAWKAKALTYYNANGITMRSISREET
jgi:hypothetical protein